MTCGLLTTSIRCIGGLAFAMVSMVAALRQQIADLEGKPARAESERDWTGRRGGVFR